MWSKKQDCFFLSVSQQSLKPILGVPSGSATEVNSFIFGGMRPLVLRYLLHNFRDLKLISLQKRMANKFYTNLKCVTFSVHSKFSLLLNNQCTEGRGFNSYLELRIFFCSLHTYHFIIINNKWLSKSVGASQLLCSIENAIISKL